MSLLPEGVQIRDFSEIEYRITAFKSKRLMFLLFDMFPKFKKTKNKQ